jgi:hypothetical protein
MDNESQAQAARGGCSPGAVNYQNNLLIDIVERLLPQGLEGWREVAVEYQRGSNEANLCHGEDVRNNWVKRLCKNMKKPTGKLGDLLDRHYRCLAIEGRIQDRANAAILGVDLAESSHRGGDGSKDSDVDNDVANAAYNGAAEVDDVGGPPADIQFSPIHPENEVDDVNEEVVAANNVGDLNEAVARGEDAVRACPQSLPLLNRASSVVSFSARGGGGGYEFKCTAPWRRM